MRATDFNLINPSVAVEILWLGTRFLNSSLYTSGWHGPAKVTGQDGTSVFVKNGGLLVKVHPCKMVFVVVLDLN